MRSAISDTEKKMDQSETNKKDGYQKDQNSSSRSTEDQAIRNPKSAPGSQYKFDEQQRNDKSKEKDVDSQRHPEEQVVGTKGTSQSPGDQKL